MREHRQCLLLLPGKVFAFRALEEKREIFLRKAPIEGILLYLQLTSEPAERGGEKMLDHAFRRRREIERMLLSGKKLTIAGAYGQVLRRQEVHKQDFEVIGEELPVVSKTGL